MRTRLSFLCGLLLLCGGALWLRQGDAPRRATPHPIAPLAAARSPSPPSVPLPRVASPPPVAPSGESLVSLRLAATSAALRNRLDEVVPARLSAEAAACYRGGLAQDEGLSLTYRLRVEDGALSVSELRIDADTTADPVLVDCIERRLLAAHWRDDDLPDIEEDDDLFLSGDSLKRFAN